MRVNRTWIENNFNKFNQQYFDNKLPMPTFQTCNTYRMLGQCGAKNWRAVHPNFVIKISIYFDRTEKEYQNTLLHEMIHLYFQSKGEWNVGHGAKFQQMARSFDKFGWNIHTTEQASNKKTTSGKIPQRVVMTFDDNRKGVMWVCCVSPEKWKMNRFRNYINENSYYSNPKFYITESDKFGSLKISHSRLGGKTMTKETFKKEWLPLMKDYPFLG